MFFKKIIHSCFLLFFLPNFLFGQTHDSFVFLRNRMVDRQIRDRGIYDKNILQAFRKVERHRFVPYQYRKYAYSDSPLPFIEGQTISQPYIVAYMTNALQIDRDCKVLEIGTGSGYQTAILAELSDSVFTIEIFQRLAENAMMILNELGYENIKCKIDDGYQGWKENAPFDVILVTCAPKKVPEPLKNQLAEGGRMIIPVGEYPFQKLILLKKKDGKIKERKVLPVSFVPMIDSKGEKY